MSYNSHTINVISLTTVTVRSLFRDYRVYCAVRNESLYTHDIQMLLNLHDYHWYDRHGNTAFYSIENAGIWQWKKNFFVHKTFRYFPV